MRGVVGCVCCVAGGICLRERAAGNIRHRGGGVAAPIGLCKHHTARRVAARSGGGDARRVLLREHKAICQHRLGGDVGGGHRAVSGAFRTIVIHRPIHRSQVSFVDGDDFFCKRGGENPEGKNALNS